LHGGCSNRDDHVYLLSQQILGERHEEIRSVGPSVHNGNVLAFGVAMIRQSASERLLERQRRCSINGEQDPDGYDPPCLLPLAEERRSERSKRQPPEERAPVHHTSAKASPIRCMGTW
jgi:hypothetical protein